MSLKLHSLGINSESHDVFEVVERPAITQEDLMQLLEAAPDLLAALDILVADVSAYEAWQRPCHALDVSIAAISKAKGKG